MSGAVLVVDAGSSSLRLAVRDAADRVPARRHPEKPPDDGAAGALEELFGTCPPVSACGHRLVHGGPLRPPPRRSPPRRLARSELPGAG